MSLLVWKPSYALGVPSVDAEHQAMIRMINEVYARLEKPVNLAAVSDVLGEIHAGIAAHFALEERLMREAGWREYRDHKEDHERLLDRIRELMDDFAEEPDQGLRQLQRELADWFAVHFATFDARLHEAFPEHAGR